jgi:hypothetical protein
MGSFRKASETTTLAGADPPASKTDVECAAIGRSHLATSSTLGTFSIKMSASVPYAHLQNERTVALRATTRMGVARAVVRMRETITSSTAPRLS